MQEAFFFVSNKNKTNRTRQAHGTKQWPFLMLNKKKKQNIIK
jgi:hypothetical protein